MAEAKPKPRRRRAHYYWWTLANTLMACIAIVSWVLCMHVFGHPEIPRNYEWLRKLGRIDEPVGFALQQAPPGDAADPVALYRRYARLEPEALSRLNAALMRNYLSSLDQSGLIQYLEGSFLIEAVRDLGQTDLFSPGFAVRARAMVQPDEFSEASPWPVEIEYLFPTTHPEASSWFQAGDQLDVAKVPNCAMVLHVARDEAGDTPLVRIACVPIVMGNYQVGDQRSFTLATPTELRPAARFPLFAEAPES